MPNLEQFIFYEPNRVTHEFCDEVVARSEQSAGFRKGHIMDGTVIDTIRDVDMTAINQWPDVDRAFFQIYGDAVRDYCGKHRDLQIVKDEGYTLLRYGPGQKYCQHVDAGPGFPRLLTAIIGLNNEYTGGEFQFWNGAWRRRIEKGALLMFPSAFLYPHGVQPIESGVRHSVITWFS